MEFTRFIPRLPRVGEVTNPRDPLERKSHATLFSFSIFWPNLV